MKFLYSFTILLGAFLLFQVQPLLGKFLLPWFGNSPGVWATCLFFFQTLLLVGYLYAHVLSRYLKIKWQIAFQILFVLGALSLMPIIPSVDLKPGPHTNPANQILLILCLTIGLPYALLAATSPLLQRWRTMDGVGTAIWRLYAVSNIGSLAALISYPFLIEPHMTVRNQLIGWSGGFAVYAGLIVIISWIKLRTSAGPHRANVKATLAPLVSKKQVLTWLLLPGLTAALLVAATNRMGQDIPAIPFLFILPLALYLITYIIAFGHMRGYIRPLFYALLPIGIGVAWYDMKENVSLELSVRIGLQSLALFCACMSCHTELVRHKPSTHYLTHFYLSTAIGGALGGAFSAWVAPQIFSGCTEYPLTLLGCFAVMSVYVCRSVRPPRSRRWLSTIYSILMFLGLSGLFLNQMSVDIQKTIYQSRNFYGVVRVLEEHPGDAQFHRYIMSHGGITHGFQYQHPRQRSLKTAYYGGQSGAGLAVRYHPRRADLNASFRIGAVGLGAGILSAWANDPETRSIRKSSPDDTIHFYEINPQVITLAERYFSYLRDARDRGAQVEVSLGDARLIMEQQLRDGAPQHFDLLTIDAFSGDSIPMHLLTQECFEIYLKHLNPDGILAFHVSNRYLHLQPVIQALADHFSYTLVDIRSRSTVFSEESSHWVLVTKNEAFLNHPVVMKNRNQTPGETPVLWTDDYGSLLSVLKRKK